MKKNVLAAVLGILYALFFCEPSSIGQGLSGTSLTVSGNASITGTSTLQSLFVTGTAKLNALAVTGPADILSDSLYFGSWLTDSTLPGVILTYTDATNSPTVTPSLLKWTAVQPSHEWLWAHMSSDQTATVPMMKLDSSHVLTIFDILGNPAIVLNPANAGGPSCVLTQQVADERYVSAGNFTVTSGVNYLGDPMLSVALTGGMATGVGSFAGFNATASGFLSNAIGIGSTASGFESTASGYRSTAIEEDSVASGAYSKASSLGAVAIGNFSNAGCWGVASGNFSTAGACWATASGYGSTASACWSTASGFGSTASGDNSVASGYLSTASGYGSTASGYGSTATGMGSTASGVVSTASGMGSNTMGYLTTAQGCFQTVVGLNNVSHGDASVWVPTDELFVIGNGTVSAYPDGSPVLDADGNPLPDTPSNAFVVKKNGDTTVYGAFTVSGTSESINSITNGGMVVTGTAVQVSATSGTGMITKVVASGSTQLVLIPEQGDLSMGDFVNGAQPLAADSMQIAQQQNVRTLSSRQTGAAIQTATSNAACLDAAKWELINRMNAIRNTAVNSTAVSRGTATSGANVIP